MPTAPEPSTSPSAPSREPATLADHLGVLERLSERPLAEHAEIYDALHAELQSALSQIDGA